MSAPVPPQPAAPAPTPERPEHSPAYAYYVLGVLFVVYVFNFVDRQVLSILIDPIKEDLGVSDARMGLLAGLAFALFYTLAGIPMARWADRGSRRTVITFSVTLWSLMTAASGLARGFASLAAARVCVGIGEAGGTPPSHSLLSDYFPPERRATALALYGNGIYVGAGLGILAGGLLMESFGDWRTAFFAVGLAGLPFAVLVALTVRELPRGVSEPAPVVAEEALGSPPAAEADGFLEAAEADGFLEAAEADGFLESADGFLGVMRFLFARPAFTWLVTGACFQAVSGYAILNWGAPFLGRVHALSYGEIGWWLGLTVMLGGCTGVTLGGWLADRLGARDVRWYMRLPAVVSLLGLPFGLGFLWLGTVYPVMGCFVVFYTVSNMYVGPLWSTAQNLARPAMRATASAVLLFILNIVGLGLGPWLVGLANDALAARLGDEAVRFSLLGVVAAGGLAAVPFWLGARHLREDLARTRER